jgi:type I restriction enzyme M protein
LTGAHREFTEEQIQNIAIISRLHRGNRQSFVELADGYYNKGFARLTETAPILKRYQKGHRLSKRKQRQGYS